MFTVGMPALNREDTISRAIDSVLAQTFEDFELVVVDDGSSDRTAEIARAYGDPRVTVLERDHRGAASARNTAIASGTGSWVTFLDSDDEVRPDWLQTLWSAAGPDVAVVSCSAVNMLPSGVIQLNEPKRMGPFFPGMTANFIYGGTYAVRRSLFEEVGGFTDGLRCSQHTDLGWRLAKQVEGRRVSFAVQREPLVLRQAGTLNSIRGDPEALYEGARQLLSIHSDLYERDHRSRSRARYRVSARARHVANFRDASRYAMLAWRDDPKYLKALGGAAYSLWRASWSAARRRPH